jgi:hypothetical protein
MVVALLHVVAVLLAGAGFLAHRAVRRRRPAGRLPRRVSPDDRRPANPVDPGGVSAVDPRPAGRAGPRRVSPVALEGAATAIGVLAIIAAIALKIW